MKIKTHKQLGIFIEIFLLWVFCTVGYAGVPMVAASLSHSAIVDGDGTLFTVGSDDSGQLGQGRLVQSATPLRITAPTSIEKVVAALHVVVLTKGGLVWTWGSNGSGQLGDGGTAHRSTPAIVPNLLNVVSVAAGGGDLVLDGFTLALKQDGSVWSWGNNSAGQLGDSTTFQRNTPVQVANLNDVIEIAAGSQHALALKRDGTVWSWGANSYGQLGDGTLNWSSVPVQVAGLANVKTIAAGGLHSIALKQDGTLASWGWNFGGQLGDASTINRSSAVHVESLTHVTAISAGLYHTVALTQDGSVWEIGNNCGVPTSVPRAVPGLADVQGIAAGVWHILARKQDGTAMAWGCNLDGQLGDGTARGSLTPVQVTDLADVGLVAAGGRASFALSQDGTLWGWGSNGYNQVSADISLRSTPTPVASLANVHAAALGHRHTLALKQDGTVWAFGSNTVGQLGDSTNLPRSSPVQVENLANVVRIAAGYSHSLALKQDGTAWSWGYNYFGQLGDGTAIYRYSPVQMESLANVSEIAAGEGHTVALKGDGTVWTWGYNAFGQLGDGTTNNRNFPTQLANLSNVIAIAAGPRHTLALKDDGTLWAWGENSSGQLGDGTGDQRLLPVQVMNVSHVIGMGAGDGYTLVLQHDGTVLTLGFSPWQLERLSGISALSAGFSHALALKQDGTVWGWGNNHYSQLGDGTFARRLTPVLATNETATGPMDLLPEVSNSIPPELIPPYWLKVTKAAEVSTAVTYNPDDLNKTGSVYVVAYLPNNSPLLTGTATASSQSASSAKDTGCPAGSAGTVPAVLTRGGWKQTDCTTPTLPLYTGTLNTANNSFGMYEASLFDQTKDNGLFCVAYAGASTGSAKGLIRSVVTGVDATLNICPPVQIGSGASGTTDTTAPSTPLSITATAAGPGQVNLSWNAATDNTAVVRYNIYRGTTLIATLDNVTSYSDISTKASTAYSYSVMACDAVANCSGQSTPAQTATPAQPSVTLGLGWNLVGNGGNTEMNVASLFGDASKIYSVWKWVKTGSAPNITYPNWAFYTPGQTDRGAAYAASKGYDTFTSIASGEGFWANVKLPLSVPMTAPAWILSSVFAPGQSKALTPGWSLIATGEAQTASAFNKAISTTPVAAGVTPINLTSLWAWQNSAQRWYFYAPSLDASGELSAYLSEKNFLDFGSISFEPTTGFWVNQ